MDRVKVVVATLVALIVAGLLWLFFGDRQTPQPTPSPTAVSTATALPTGGAPSPNTVSRSPSPSASVSAAGGELPLTGGGSLVPLAVAAVALAVGASLLAASRIRRVRDSGAQGRHRTQ